MILILVVLLLVVFLFPYFVGFYAGQGLHGTRLRKLSILISWLAMLSFITWPLAFFISVGGLCTGVWFWHRK